MAFPIAPSSTQPGEQTVGLVYNQDTAQWERVYRQAASGRPAEPPEALSQEMPVDPPDEDSLRRYVTFSFHHRSFMRSDSGPSIGP